MRNTIAHVRTIRRDLDELTARVTAKRDDACGQDKTDFRFIGVRLEKALQQIDAIIERFEA